MGIRKVLAALAILVVGTNLGMGTPRLEARPNLVLSKFLLGKNYGAWGFRPVAGRGATGVFRDSSILLVFTAPVDFDTVNSRTVRIGIPTTAGLVLPAEGSFYRVVGRRFDPVSNTFIDFKVFRNRILFDPTSPDDGMFCVTPEGLEENSLYTVTIPGIDRGPIKTLETPDGRPNMVTFTTSFTTGEEYMDPNLQDLFR
jgi:hypothetical protein